MTPRQQFLNAFNDFAAYFKVLGKLTANNNEVNEENLNLYDLTFI